MEVNSGSSISCIKTCLYKGRRGKNSSYTCKKHDRVGVAAWLCQTVAAAFFASLDWCSCMYVDTSDDGSEDDSNVHLNLISNSEKGYSYNTQINLEA